MSTLSYPIQIAKLSDLTDLSYHPQINLISESLFFQNKYSLNEKVDQYIREHYRENIGRTEIAEQFYLAPEYLSKTYKKLTGRTIKDTITEYRIDEAKRMLERGERVSDVAETVGFDNFTYFSTIFKKYTGVSPNQYCKK